MSIEPLERKLTAILYADVAGYSRLTGEDEEGTHRALSAYLDTLTTSIEKHNGTVLHFAGDAVLADFATVSDALICAVAVQGDLNHRNNDLPDQRKVQFRIGVNLGEVIVDRNEIYGDGVNVAARLESLAEPGGIYISESVHTTVGNKLPLDYEFIGEQTVKNIAKPVRAYSARLKSGATLPAPSARPRARWPMRHGIAATAATAVLIIIVGVITWLKPWEPESDPNFVEALRYRAPVAVLPFKNLSGDPEMESFTDGLTEDIITDFAKFPVLFVIASNTVFTYKDKPINVQDVGHELGVRYVLEGSTEKTGDTIRITAQFIDAGDGNHLWAERYTGTLTDKFAIRDEARWSIIANLFGGLGILTRAEYRRAIEKPPESRDAYDYVQLAFEEINKHTKEATVEAMQFAEKAVTLDPAYARALQLLSWAHYREAQMGWGGGDRDKSLELAYQHARKSWELDPSDYDAHWQLGTVYLKLGQHDQAMAAYERARELNPNDADLLADTAYSLILVGGRSEEAIASMKQAMQRKSNWPKWFSWTLGLAYWDAGQYQDALTIVKGIAEPGPRGLLLVASIYVRLSRFEEARAEVVKYLKANPGHTLKDIRKYPFKDPAQTKRYLDDLRTAGLPE